MKRFLLFYGHKYDASGGMKDLIGEYDTIEEAKDKYYELLLDGFDDTFHDKEEYLTEQKQYIWHHIFDTQTRQFIFV